MSIRKYGTGEIIGEDKKDEGLTPEEIAEIEERSGGKVTDVAGTHGTAKAEWEPGGQ
jgi:hypothetical protein